MTNRTMIPVTVLRDLFRALRAHPEGLTAAELSSLLEAHQTSVYRYVLALSRVGILEPAGHVSPGPRGGPRARRWRLTA